MDIDIQFLKYLISDLTHTMHGVKGQLDWYSPTGDIHHFTLTQPASATSQIFHANMPRVRVSCIRWRESIPVCAAL